MITDKKNIPNNVDLEQEILGLVFLNDKRIKDMVDEIKLEHFYHPHHKEIYEAMLYFYRNNKPINYTDVIDRLKTKKSEVKPDYILGLTDTVASEENAEYKLTQLKEVYEKRKLYEISSYIINNDISGITSEDLSKRIRGVIDNFKVASNIETTDAKDYIDDWFTQLKKPLDETARYLFGFKGLDDLIMLDKGNLVTVAALAGQGKSIFALNMVKNLCLQEYKTLFISLEMSEKEIMDRMVSNISKVSMDSIKKHNINESEERRVKEAVEQIKEFDWKIFDKGFMNIDHLYNLSKKLHKEGKLDVLVVDYIGLLDGGNKQSRVQEVSYITRRLKQLAQEISIPVIQLSQLNRNVTGKDGKIREPQLADLRESGSVEQDSNAVIFLHPKSLNTEKYENKFLKLIVRKNRNGRLGDIDYEFVGDTMTFIEKEWIDGKPVPVQQLDLKNRKKEVEIDIDDSDLPF